MTPSGAPHFGDELVALKDEVIAMGRLAEERVRLAIRGLVSGDRAMLADVVANDHRLDRAQLDLDKHCLGLLALFHPVAVDLRVVVSALRINTDLERVGDLAVNIAEGALRYIQHPPVKPLVDLPRMGELSLTMLREAIDAFVSGDTSAAHNVLRQDEWLDVLNHQIVRELLTYALGNARIVEPSVDLILIARHLERVGDHATNIAEDVIFLVDSRDFGPIRTAAGAREATPQRHRARLARAAQTVQK